MTNYFTFFSHVKKVRDRYLIICGSESEAIAEMDKDFKGKWAFRFSESQFKASAMTRKMKFISKEQALAAICNLRHQKK